jgi:hypothetical protein
MPSISKVISAIGDYRPFGVKPKGSFSIARGLFTKDGLDRMPATIRAQLPPVAQTAQSPYVGVTADGHAVPGLYPLPECGPAPEDLVTAAVEYLTSLPSHQETDARVPVDDIGAWRLWTNAFPDVFVPKGILLEDLSPISRQQALNIISKSISASGYRTVRSLMRLNQALGELVLDYGDTLREYMYWFTIFGEPHATGPWGWTLMGHHIDISCFVLGGQVVLSPMFLGAEPVYAADGTYSGESALMDERANGLRLRMALTESQARRAVLFGSMLAKDLPPHLAGQVEGRLRSGAGRDNLVMPYEGICASEMSSAQRELLLELVAGYVGRLPAQPAAARMLEVERHLMETWFAWIGGSSLRQAFYYKIHSPVVLIEYDNHVGVFLGNRDPEPFHVHTIIRTPNGNDYGRDLLRQHYMLHH